MIRRHLPLRQLSPAGDGWQYWVGYYDIAPWSPDSTKLLCHRARFADRFPDPGEPCEVGFLDLTASSPAFTALGESLAWNWQQGAMLRWFDERNLIFNDRADRAPAGPIVARIVDTHGSKQRTLPGPALALAPDRSAALSLSMGRINAVRFEYGYPGDIDANPGIAAPEDDGVFRIDLNTGERTLIVPLSKLALGLGDREPFAYANHLMYNRSGTRFCFVHRYERADGITQTRLFTANATDGSDLRLLMTGMVSHYDWRDDATILAWAGFRKLLGGTPDADANAGPSAGARAMTAARRTLKPIYYALGKPRFLMNKIVKDAYMLIPDEDGADARGSITKWAQGELICDGHCSFNRGGDEPGRWVVTDGYPDRGRQPLFLWDDREGVGYEVARPAAPAHLENETRVDLHPRLSADASRICIDSAHEGDRRIYEIDATPITRANGPARRAAS